MATRPLYRHRQPGWVMLGGAVIVLPWMYATLRYTDWAIQLPWFVLALPLVMAAMLALLFHSLDVIVTRDALIWRFGVGLIGKRVMLAEIERIGTIRTRFRNGWGIKRTPHGWLYNVSGFDAIEMRLKSGKRIVLGTDEPRRLMAVMERALADRRARS